MASSGPGTSKRGKLSMPDSAQREFTLEVVFQVYSSRAVRRRLTRHQARTRALCS